MGVVADYRQFFNCLLKYTESANRLFTCPMASREEGTGSRHSLTGQDSEAAVHRHHRKGHRRSLMHTNIAESLKIKQVRTSVTDKCSFYDSFLQARTKALREQQRSRLDGRHKYIISLVALRVCLTDAEVEDFLLDGNQVVFCLACFVMLD